MTTPSVPDVPERTVVGLLVPADPDRALGLHLLPDASVALSEALGGGLLAEPEVWLLGAAGAGADDVRRVHVYRRDGAPASRRDADGQATNRRLAALADLLDVPPRSVPPVDALLVGGRPDGGDTDVPAVVLATALHSGWAVEMDVSAPADREAGEPRW